MPAEAGFKGIVKNYISAEPERRDFENDSLSQPLNLRNFYASQIVIITTKVE